MEEALSKEERRAAKKIAKSWKKFKDQATTTTVGFTGLEPILALAMDLERKLVLLLPNVLEGLYPTPITLESLSVLESMKASFDNIIWNLSKNVKHWNSNFHETDYSIRLEELAIKFLDQDMDVVVDFSNWCLMNCPTNETLECLQHLDQVDWDYTFGRVDTPDVTKLHIPTYDIVNDDLVYVPFKAKEKHYKYACSASPENPFSVLSTLDVVEVSTSEVVISENVKYCQLRLPENLYLAAFLKADEQKQSVIRYLSRAAGVEALEGGEDKIVRNATVYYVNRGWVGYLEVKNLFKLLGFLVALTVMGSMFSSIALSTSRCVYKGRDAHVPTCVTNLYSSRINFVLPFALEDETKVSEETSKDLLDDSSFTRFLGKVVTIESNWKTVQSNVERTHMNALQDATAAHAFSTVVKQTSLTQEVKLNAFQALLSYALEVFYPSAPNLTLNLTSVSQVDVVVEAMESMQQSLPGVFVGEEIMTLSNLRETLDQVKPRAKKLQQGDVRFLQLQAQIFVLQTTLDSQFVFLNNRYFDVFQSVIDLHNLVDKVKEDFSVIITKITNGVPNLASELNNAAVVLYGTQFGRPGYTYKSELQNLAYNYRVLLHNVALPLYILDSNLNTFPDSFHIKLSEEMSLLVNVLKDLMIDMLNFKKHVGLQERSFVVAWFESLVGDYTVFDSVQNATRITKNVVDLNVEIMKNNKESYKLLAHVMEKMQELQSELRQDYSVAKENWVTAQLQVYSRYVTTSLANLPSFVGLETEFFSSIYPYFNVPDMIDNFKAQLDESRRELNEQVRFTSRTRVANKMVTRAFTKVCQLGLSTIENVESALWTEKEGQTIKMGFELFKYALKFGLSAVHTVDAGVNFFTLGDIPTIEVQPPKALEGWLPKVKVSEANIRDWRMPKVELTLGNTSFVVPSFYLGKETNPDENRKLQIMLEHLISKYTNFKGPFNIETELDYTLLTDYIADNPKRQ